MKIIKRITSLLLCTVYVAGILGLTGCSSINRAEQTMQVSDSCKVICESVKNLDYDTFSEYIYEDSPKLKEFFKLGEGQDDKDTVAVRKAIASTLRSRVHEDTLKFATFGNVATVNVDFMLVDYKRFAETNKFYRDVTSMEESLKEYDLFKYTMIYTMPMRFVWKDGKALLDNAELLEQIFAFADFDEIVFADNLTRYLKDYSFKDSEDGTYTSPDKITLEIGLDEKGSRFDWIYDYEVAYTPLIGGEETVFTDSDETKRGSESIVINYSTGKTLDPGSYRISIKYDGQQADYSCNVKAKEEDYTEGGVFSCPEGKTYNLKQTKVSVNLKDDYFFVSADSSLGKDLLNTYGKSRVEFIASYDDGDYASEFMYCLIFSGFGIRSDEEVIKALCEGRQKGYEQMGCKTKIKRSDLKIGNKSYKSADFEVTYNGSKSYLRMIVVPNPLNYHVVAIYAQSKDEVKTFTSMLKG